MAKINQEIFRRVKMPTLPPHLRSKQKTENKGRLTKIIEALSWRNWQQMKMNKPYFLTAHVSFAGTIQEFSDLVLAPSKKKARQKFKDYLLATLPKWKVVKRIAA